ncbi:tyrosine-type recombinase/integrase [Paenibacillus sp. HJGM_3]|uniref:tyrosine-type recombinase/integrase n=1 Tax=Paenibacillus sp. HJGM_3 TaxID=3379816 RepID=UPI003858E9C8
MAYIEKRGANSWRLTVDIGTDPSGKRISRKKTIKIEDTALLKTTKKLQSYLDEELVKFKMEVEAGEYISPDKLTFSAFVEVWLNKFVRKELEYKTQENYEFHTNKRILPYFGSMKIEKIRALHVIDYLDKLSESGLGSASIVYNYRVLRSMFNKAVEWQVIKESPMKAVKKPKEKPSVELNVYDEEESMQLFKALEDADNRFKILITLALTTGMRRAELLGLEWKNIDLTTGTIQVIQSIPAYKEGEPVIKLPKNPSSVRPIAISPSVLEELKQYRKEWLQMKMQVLKKWKAKPEQEFLFMSSAPGAEGKPVYPKRLSEWWREFHSEKLGHLKYIRFHDFRHTSVTLLINQGVHAKIISERVGHSKIGTTMDKYGHVIRKADQAAADLFDKILERKVVQSES